MTPTVNVNEHTTYSIQICYIFVFIAQFATGYDKKLTNDSKSTNLNNISTTSIKDVENNIVF